MSEENVDEKYGEYYLKGYNDYLYKIRPEFPENRNSPEYLAYVEGRKAAADKYDE